MHGQLVFLNPLHDIHWLIFSDSILFVITMCRRCILCMCICVVIIQLFRLPYVNKRIVYYATLNKNGNARYILADVCENNRINA